MDELREVNRHTRIAYDLAASRYHELYAHELAEKPYDRALLDDFAGRCAPHSRIHEVGCGSTGHIGHYLRARGLQVTGSDISRKCIELASACHPEMQFAVMDMANLALADQATDGIVSYYSIIHTPKRFVPELLREFHRVLKSNGKLLLAAKEGGKEGYLHEFLGFRTTVYFTHFRRDEIARFLSESGFEILFLETRDPLAEEIPVPRIFAIGEKR